MNKENVAPNQAVGTSSIYLLDVKKGACAYRYDVDVEISLPNDRTKSLCKGRENNNETSKSACRDLVKTAFQLTGSFGDEEIAYVYDRSSILFTSKPILNGIGRIPIRNLEASELVRRSCGKCDFIVNIKAIESSHVVQLSNLAQYAGQKSGQFYEERSTRSCLEMILSAEATESNKFFSSGGGYLYENQIKKELRGGIGLKFGITKGVGVVKNGKGGVQTAVFLDVTCGPFFMSQNVMNSIRSMFFPKDSKSLTQDDWKQFIHLYKGVRATVTYQPSKTVSIMKLSALPISQSMFPYEGKKISVYDYFTTIKKVPLKFPHFPGLVNQLRQNFEEVIPLECLVVVDNQHVPTQKKTPEIMDAVRQENIVQANVRFNQIQDSMAKLGLTNPKNQFMSKFGVRVVPQSNECPLKSLEKSKISMGGRQIVPEDKSNWRTGNLSYSKGADIKKWAVFCRPEDKGDVEQFVKLLVEQGGRKGMKFAQPTIIPPFPNYEDINVWFKVFSNLRAQKFEFLLYVGEKSKNAAGDAKTNHGVLKLFEALSKVTTEHVSIDSVKKCLTRDVSTLQNILNKINCKNGGQNYFPLAKGNSAYFLEKGDTLVISYDVCHPKPSKQRTELEVPMAGGLEPSVVGICANVGQDPHYFLGDYFYQQPRKESVDHAKMDEYIKWLLKMLAKNRPKNARPKNVFVIRDGISQGQYQMAYDEELRAIKKACYEFDQQWKPKFCMIISTKDHNKVFFDYNEKNGKPCNPWPGTIIDSKFVRNDCFEFYLLAHNPPQGTARFTQYNVILNELQATNSDIENFIHALCYEHQIISAAVSIPASIYLADKLASRGADLYMEMKKNYPVLKTLFQKLPVIPATEETYGDLSKFLGCKNSRLEAENFSA